MAKIIITSLLARENKTFFNKVTQGQLKAVLGGGYPYYFHIFNVTDSVSLSSPGGDNTYEAVNHSVSYHDNKIHTVDYARSNYNIFYY